MGLRWTTSAGLDDKGDAPRGWRKHTRRMVEMATAFSAASAAAGSSGGSSGGMSGGVSETSPETPARRSSRSSSRSRSSRSSSSRNQNKNTGNRRPIDTARICATFDRGMFRAGGSSSTSAAARPKFGDLTQYGVSEENERRVWAAEVRRLAAAVAADRDSDSEADSEAEAGADFETEADANFEADADADVLQLEGPAEWYGGDADANGYSCLHDLAHSFQMALEICTHDDLIVASKSHPQQDYSHPIALSYNRLERNFDDKIQRRKYEHLGRGGNRAFHAFVNYVTATVALVLMRVGGDGDGDKDSDGDSDWADNCLASLAQFASKMKVVGYDLPITTAISMAVFLRSQPLLSPVKLKHSLTETDMDSLDPLGLPDPGLVAPLVEFNQTVQQLLRDATATLLWDAATAQPSDVFETSAVVYDSGFHGARRHLCQERSRRIGSAAGRSTVQCASVVFDVCRALWRGLPADDDRPVPCRTYVDWSWTTERDRDRDRDTKKIRRRSLTNMKDVISALVPYTMFCGPFPSTLARLVRASFLSSPPAATRLASVRIRTSQYTELHAQLHADAHADAPAHKNVYDTALAQERALAGSADDAACDGDTKRRRYGALNERLREATAQMEHWTIGPHTITVNDRWFCRAAVSAVGLLAMGVLSVSVCPDVYLCLDRPNLVVLVWAAAGFLMAYVKSMRVAAWPWHDFLRGQVVCRSVSEVHAVTQINPQTLLAALLLWTADDSDIDRGDRLQTSGPFCSLFRQAATAATATPAAGFDIDIAPLNDTAMAGGHVFVVVSTRDGPALIDLASRPGDEHYTSVPNAGSNTTSGDLREALYCINARSPDRVLTFVREREDKDATAKTKTRTKTVFLPMYRLSDNGVLEWNRVLGVLDDKSIFR